MKILLCMLFDISRLPREIVKNRFLLKQMVIRNVNSRYKGSMLGLIWSFMQPLMMLAIYTFVFSVVFKARWGVDVSNSQGAFAIIMFCGMAIFNIFSESVATSCYTIIGNPNYVKKVIFPLEILPLSQVISSFIMGIPWFLLLFVGVIWVLGTLSFYMLLLPLVLIPLFFFSLGIAYFVASLAVYVRDVSYVVGIILQMLFFMTPIFYPIKAVPEQFQVILKMNPLTVYIEEGRKVFLYASQPDWVFLGLALLISLVILQFGFVWFQKTKKGFADVI